MKTLRQYAGANPRRKYDVQNSPAKYWATMAKDPSGRRPVQRGNTVIEPGDRPALRRYLTQTDKTAGFHSRPVHKEQLRNANRSMNKRARQMLKQQMAQERLTARQIVTSLLEYNFDPTAPQPRYGGPDDPMRQALGPLPPMTFGERPGQPPSSDDEIVTLMQKQNEGTITPEEQERLDALLDQQSQQSRFNWKPPTGESICRKQIRAMIQ